MALARENFLDRTALAALQGERLRALVAEIIPRNELYTQKLARAGIDADQLCCPSDLARIPFTTKAELLTDQEEHPPYGTVLTYPLQRYTRLHQTSGTHGKPLRWLDTPDSWEWMLNSWRQIFAAAEVTADDRLFFPFSFGPFLGFWTAFDAGQQLGCLCLA